MGSDMRMIAIITLIKINHLSPGALAAGWRSAFLRQELPGSEDPPPAERRPPGGSAAQRGSLEAQKPHTHVAGAMM